MVSIERSTRTGALRSETLWPYSSLPRVTTIEASVLVRVHSMLRRRKRMETLSPRSKPMRLMQREVPVNASGFGIVKMMAPAEAIRSKNCGFGLRSALGVELDGIVAAAAAERQLLRRRMRQIDHVAGIDADLDAVDLVLQFLGGILAAVGPRRRCAERGEQRQRGGKQGRSAKLWSQSHCECPFAPLNPARGFPARAARGSQLDLDGGFRNRRGRC